MGHIGLLEGILTLFILTTFIKYGMNWAYYFERKMNKQAEKKPKIKKTKKGHKETETEKEEEEEDSLGPKPTVYDTLPFQVYELCKQVPTLPKYLREMNEEYRERKEEEKGEQKEVEEAKKRFEERKLEKKQKKTSVIRTDAEE